MKELLTVIIISIFNVIGFYFYTSYFSNIIFLILLILFLILSIPLYFLIRRDPFLKHYGLNFIATILSISLYLIYMIFFDESGGYLLFAILYYFIYFLLIIFLLPLIFTFCQRVLFFIIGLISLALRKKEY